MSLLTEKQVTKVLTALKRATGNNQAKDIAVGQALGMKPSTVKSIRTAGSWAEYERRKGVKAEKKSGQKVAGGSVTVTKGKKATNRVHKPRAVKQADGSILATVGSIPLAKVRLTAKGHAGPSTTPPLYDAKAAIEDLKREMLSADIKAYNALLEAQRTIRRVDATVQALVEEHNLAIKVETPPRRRSWPFVIGKRG